MKFVLDNSVAMCWLLKDGTPSAIAYAGDVIDALRHDEAVVPAIWSLEVANVVARVEAKGVATHARTQSFLSDLVALNIETDVETAERALGETLNLSRQYRLSAYDAAYLELALRKGLSIATLDDALLRAARRAGLKRYDPA